MFKFLRGEVYLVEEHQTKGSEIKKTRPWICVGANPINAARGTIVSIPLSTHAPIKPPISIKVYFNNVIQVAVIDQIRALDKKRFIRLEGQLSDHEMDLVSDSLMRVLWL